MHKWRKGHVKLWLKNNLSKSEECVSTEPLACTDLICNDSFEIFWKFKRHFLKSLVIRIWWWNKRAWVGKMLPFSDIVFKLFTELVRAARRTVVSGISSLFDFTFRMRGCQRCHSKLEQHMKWSFLRHLCLRRYFGGVYCILYSSGSSARRNLRNLRKSVNPVRPI